MPESRKKQNFISYRSSNGCTSRVSFHSGFDLEGGRGLPFKYSVVRSFCKNASDQDHFSFQRKDHVKLLVAK